MIFLFVYKYRLYQLVYPNQHLPVQSIEQHSYTRYDTRSQLTKTVKSFRYIINFEQTFEYNKAGLKHFLIVNSYKTTGETTYDDDLTPVLSLFTGISYFIKPYCWIIFFSLLQLQFYVNLLFKRPKNFPLHTFSFFLLDHHRR